MLDANFAHAATAGTATSLERDATIHQAKRAAIELPRVETVKKQSAKRHFGVHGYFTRQAYEVVRAYIERFSEEGETILDSFGGSGVTLVESLMLGRKAIHVDINPLSVFIVKNLIEPVAPSDLSKAAQAVGSEFLQTFPKTEEDYTRILKTYSHPKAARLMKNADVASVERLFSKRQTAQLALLKSIIQKQENEKVRGNLMLAFSSTVTKTNLTYHGSASRGDNAGDASAFRYYRYRLAAAEVELDLLETFATKIKKLINAKEEVSGSITSETIKDALIFKGSATDLSRVESESVSYIYTDPPYGSKIPYLDLSVMWNSWLDFEASESDYRLEAIEGGEFGKTKDDYFRLLEKSFREMYRVLKTDRYMSVVFSHQNPDYWKAMIEATEAAGFEYVGSVYQNNGSTSFKKRQNPFSVLAGQIIVTFRKRPTGQRFAVKSEQVNIDRILNQTLMDISAKKIANSREEFHNTLIIRALENQCLPELSLKYRSSGGIAEYLNL